MNREEIKEFIPHRDNMLLVDNIEVDSQSHAHATYYVRGDEFFLQGHFPGHPVVPGVIICEIMAQSSSLLIGDFLKGKTPFFGGLDKVRFKKQVRPHDTICIESEIMAHHGATFFIKATAKTDGDICCEGNMSFMLIDTDKLHNNNETH